MGILLNGSDMGTAYGFRASRPAGWADAPPRTIQTTPLLNRAGATALQRPQEQPRKLTIAGSIIGSSVSDRLAKADALKAALSSASGVQLVFPDMPNRYLTVFLDTFTVNATVGAVFAERTVFVDIGLTAYDPYFYDSTLTTVASGASIALGTAPSRPVITVAGASSFSLNFYIVDTPAGNDLRDLALTGSTIAGDTLVIDCDAMTITKNGVNALASLVGGDFFVLDPALAIFQASPAPRFYANGNTNATMTYRKAWR